MPRTARVLADNQIYHIINRGNRREAVFHDNYDYEKFLKLPIESYLEVNLKRVKDCIGYKDNYENMRIKNEEALIIEETPILFPENCYSYINLDE